MSCKDFEHLIALHVEGDGSEAERQRVESHLRTCSDCWDLAEDLKESQAVFKSIREDVPNPAMLSAVRARVLEDVAGRESGTWFERIFLSGFRQKATLAGMVLMVVVSGALWFTGESEAPIAPRPTVVIDPPAVPDPLPQAVWSRPDPKPPVRYHKPAPVAIPQEPQQQAQVMIRLLTDDPNVIIYWLGDVKGD
jgi:Putative zinc-finger